MEANACGGSFQTMQGYPAKTITDADYADDLAILANTPNHAEKTI